MAAASLQSRAHHHQPLKLLNRDSSNIYLRAKPQTIAKRRSAVEILQETKPLYVKSETVLDRKQELPRSQYGFFDDDMVFCSSYSSSSGPISLMGCSPTSSNASGRDASTLTLPLPKSPRLIPPPHVFRKSTGSFQLQNRLRKLLNVSKEDLLDTKENATEIPRKNKSDINGNMLICTENGLDKIPPIPPPRYVTNHSIGNCHKSLPDLSNVYTLPPDHHDIDVSKCEPSCLSSSDNAPKRQCQLDSVSSFSSCKNERLFISGDSNQTEEFNLDSPDGNVNFADSLPISGLDEVISPPSMYCDIKIQDSLSQIRTCAINRSKSDVGSRASSSLNPIEIPLYDPANLNTFFDNLGLDSLEYSSLTAPCSDASSPVYFDSSNSSVDSLGGYASGGDATSINYASELPSIVERNARIIKWLCNCRKAMDNIPRIVTPQSR